jgi:MoaA/NifB/PqqE/SkfB family radical SAM enzyme
MDEIYSPGKINRHPLTVLNLMEGSMKTLPVHVIWSPCDTCNHHCSWCQFRNYDFPQSPGFNRPDGSPPVRHTPIELAEKFLDDCYAAGVKAVSVTGGGEPMLHPEFPAILKGIIHRGMAFSVTTNGTRYAPEWKSLLAKAVWIRVSINGGTEEAYRSVHNCGRGQWDAAWQFVSAVAKTGPTVGVNMVVDERNKDTVLDLVRKAKRHGAAYAKLTREFRDDGDHSSTWASTWFQRLDAMKLQEHDFRVLVRGESFDTSSPAHKECHYQFVAPYVGGDGKVYRCCNTSHTPHGLLGDLAHESLASIMERAWLDRETFDARKCGHCTFKDKNEAIRKAVAPAVGHDLFV